MQLNSNAHPRAEAPANRDHHLPLPVNHSAIEPYNRAAKSPPRRVLGVGAEFVIGAATTLALVLVGAFVFNVVRTEDGETTAQPTLRSDTSVAGSSSQADDDGAASVSPAPPATASLDPELVVTRTEGELVVSGAVPDAALAEQLLTAAETSFLVPARSELAVDTGVEPVAWLGRASTVVGAFSVLIDGRLEVSSDRAVVSGTAGDEADVAAIEEALAALGVSEVISDIVVTDLAPPSLTLARTDGVMSLGGSAPSPEVRAALVAAMGANYPPDTSVAELGVDSSVYEAHWLSDVPTWLEVLSAFPNYELRADGDGYSGFISDEATLFEGSTEVSPQLAAFLAVLADLIESVESPTVVITAHTDATRAEDVNHDLSHDWGDLAADHLVDLGVRSEGIKVVGAGGTDPIASDDTATGRARNRRLEFSITTTS